MNSTDLKIYSILKLSPSNYYKGIPRKTSRIPYTLLQQVAICCLTHGPLSNLNVKEKLLLKIK